MHTLKTKLFGTNEAENSLLLSLALEKVIMRYRAWFSSPAC